MKRVHSNLTYANVISTLCMFLLLGGGAAYAASHLGKNSVGTKQLKKNAVTGAKVKNGSLTGQDIDLGSLGSVATAGKAGFATSAGTAQSAASAGIAATATTAGNGATAIDWEGPAVQVRPSNIILHVGELTLTAWCQDPNGQKEATYVVVEYVSTKPGSVGLAFNYLEDTAGVHQGFSNFNAGSPEVLVNQRAFIAAAGLQDGMATFRFDDRVITVLLHARADNIAHACQVNGTAMSAP